MSVVAENIIKVEALFEEGKPMKLERIAEQLWLLEPNDRFHQRAKTFLNCWAALRDQYGEDELPWQLISDEDDRPMSRRFERPQIRWARKAA
jgi:hypothetical protein